MNAEHAVKRLEQQIREAETAQSDQLNNQLQRASLVVRRYAALRRQLAESADTDEKGKHGVLINFICINFQTLSDRTARVIAKRNPSTSIADCCWFSLEEGTGT